MLYSVNKMMMITTTTTKKVTSIIYWVLTACQLPAQKSSYIIYFNLSSNLKDIIPRWQYCSLAFPSGTVVKNLPDDAGDARDMGSISESGRSPGVRNGNPLQYSYLENSQIEEPGGLRALELRRAAQDWAKLHTHPHFSDVETEILKV